MMIFFIRPIIKNPEPQREEEYGSVPTWTGVGEKADQEWNIVHCVQVGPDVLNAAGQLGTIAHVILKKKTENLKRSLVGRYCKE